jgi:hypothetical protein
MNLEEVAWSTEIDLLAKATVVLYTDSTISQPYLSSPPPGANKAGHSDLTEGLKKCFSNTSINMTSTLRDAFKTGIPVSADRANLSDAPDADVPKNSNAWPRQPCRSSDAS